MITHTQLLLARTLCGWSLKDAAKRLNTSHPNLSKYELGSLSVKSEKLRFMQSVYEINGVAFTAGGGVEPRGTGIIELQGRDGFAWFREDVLFEVENGYADICVSNVDESLFDQWGKGEVNDRYRAEMAKLVEKNPDVHARFLIKQGDSQWPAKKHAEYRYVGEKDFGDFPLYVYGQKTAMLLFGEHELDIIIIKNPKVTNFYRKIFNEKWADATPVAG